MTSLRRRLFALLLAATGVLWLSAVLWIDVVSRNELEHVLDTRLQEAARMVHSLVGSGNMPTTAPPALEDSGYSRQLSCQIWSLDGRLLAQSSGAPTDALAPDGEGFAVRSIAGETWRVYTIQDTAKAVRVTVGDRLGLRQRLVRDLVSGLIWPAVLIAPLLGVLIWAGLRHGLRPLTIAARDIAARDGDDMRPIDAGGAPDEIRPLLGALNSLFGKVETARRHERDLTAFAAHELRTPLAGLRAQAQIALTARDDAIRDGALRQVLIAVDRTSRLARQLLALAELEAGAEPADAQRAGAAAVLRDVVRGCAAPRSLTVEIADDVAEVIFPGSADMLALALRNLHENALDHATARVVWRALPDGTGLAVEDDGPGMSADECQQATRRFWRGRHRSRSGSGLGLTITEMASRHVGATLHLSQRDQGAGLRATLRILAPPSAPVTQRPHT